MTTSPESSAAKPTAKAAAKSAQLRGRTEPHMQSINMPQREPIDPYERPSYPFFYVPTDLLIGGSWVTGDNGSFPVHNPSYGQILAHVADASIEQGIEALDAACSTGVSVLRPRRPCSDGMERPASDRYAASAEGSDRRP